MALIIYCIFSYSFMLGMRFYEGDTPIVVILLAPIMMPAVLAALVCNANDYFRDNK